MTVSLLPTSPAAFAKATWEEILPYYEDLAERPLDVESVDEWLRAWSTLEELLTEAAAQAMIAYTVNTADPEREADHLRFSTQILPRMEEQGVRLAKRLLALGYTRPDLEVMRRRFATGIAIFREENVSLLAEIEEHSARYQKLTGGMTARWDGEDRPLPQLQPYLRHPDRSVREAAFRAITGPYLAQREALADVFDRLYALRVQVARNAGFADFEAYTFRAKCRFDYTPADCRRFHEAVEEFVVPAVERIYERRRRRLGVDTLRPWDVQVDPEGRPALVPFGSAVELMARARRAFDRVDPELGAEFQVMIDEGLLDLESRTGKAPGGYCETLHFRGRPFIFMNAAGTVDDVMTLLHEAGHAFHAFAAHAQPLIWQRHPGSEVAELASMSMELLALPHLAGPGGFFTEEELRRAKQEHLEDILLSLAHIASVDAFQSWIYTSGRGHDRLARDEAWLEIRRRFDRGLDWSGLTAERVARWYRQLHIFLYPFYYIEYGLAQLGALQVWRHSLTDPRGAVASYRRALALGSTRSLPELFAAAGARFTVEREEMAALVALVERELEALDGA
ncbi:MAG TPA: M3 family oligoendopeptidase [Gemmatimonadales bacterium]|nr:M3 family oligoendopeptidase [Gemmatimonadales bacterium]